jgi:hypothetical protein
LSFWLDRQARKARPLRRAFFRLADSDVTDGKYFKADWERAACQHVLPGLASDVLFSMHVASAKLLQAEKAKNSSFPQNWL